MENLTPEQRAKLDALVARLNKLPTPGLIVEASRLRLPTPLDEVGKRRFRLAFSGGVAAQKLLSYIEALEEVDDHRDAIGRQIFQLRNEGQLMMPMESIEAAESFVLAAHLAGWQKVDFHFLAVCVGRIERLLPIAARAAGYKIPKGDRALLGSYRPLRDHYEHLEDCLPGGKNYAAAESEEEVDGKWRIRLELALDSDERIVMNGAAMDVTPRGVATVRPVLRRYWEQFRPSALAWSASTSRRTRPTSPTLGPLTRVRSCLAGGGGATSRCRRTHEGHAKVTSITLTVPVSKSMVPSAMSRLELL